LGKYNFLLKNLLKSGQITDEEALVFADGVSKMPQLRSFDFKIIQYYSY